MKPATPFQKMRERRIEREQLVREVAKAEARVDKGLCSGNLEALRAGLKPPHPLASNYQECLQVFSKLTRPPYPSYFRGGKL